MKDEPEVEFQSDQYIERLLKLREAKPEQYNTYPQAVRDTVDEYEREKKEHENKGSPVILMIRGGNILTAIRSS
jgi:hypothetical protein